ncbi:MAG: D-cysteine desulfhydrase [Solirubrobacteraceae bacterium]|jgi:1-aminocyclopropane-1-carboxylate deaminase/D-cysteine desulfhydrase|nr:D-cysteine desulfhydrase [Solirubrobacteraceae bacterium]
MADPWAPLPRASLAALPTPLHRLPRFSEAIGADVWIKRDDVGSLGLAGNKVRKLEFVLGAARANGADVVVIVGAEQSNAARAAAAACAQLDMRCVLVLSGDEPARPSGNLLLDHLFGAEVRFAGTKEWAALAQFAEEVEAQLRREGATPYALPAGASSPLGAIGFAVAWSELLGQLDAAGVRPSAVIHAASSGGTHAGLVAGRHLTGGGPRVRGILVADDIYPDMAGQYAALAREAGRLLGADVPVTAGDLWLDDRFLGEGYAVPSPEAVEAIQLLARTEAVVCDPVYSGKALAALVASARAGELDGPTVFWHTGGWHALFAPRFSEAVLPCGPGAQRD